LNNSVTVREIGRTEDSDDSVFRATIGESWLDFLFPSDRDDDLWVHMVESTERGDMKRMLDHICQEYECRRVRFCNPLNDTLAERLNGFEHGSEVFDDPDSPFHGSRFESLVGIWEADDAR
jgi:hypothetical protein